LAPNFDLHHLGIFFTPLACFFFLLTCEIPSECGFRRNVCKHNMTDGNPQVPPASLLIHKIRTPPDNTVAPEQSATGGFLAFWFNIFIPFVLPKPLRRVSSFILRHSKPHFSWRYCSLTPRGSTERGFGKEVRKGIKEEEGGWGTTPPQGDPRVCVFVVPRNPPPPTVYDRTMDLMAAYCAAHGLPLDSKWCVGAAASPGTAHSPMNLVGANKYLTPSNKLHFSNPTCPSSIYHPNFHTVASDPLASLTQDNPPPAH